MAARRGAKTSLPTDIVLAARHKYPDRINAVKAYMGDVPYLKEKMDPRAADKRLMMMDENAMAELARTDPVAAEQAAARIQQIQQKAPSLPPGMGEFEE